MVIVQIESAKPLFSPPVWRQGGGNMRTYKEYIIIIKYFIFCTHYIICFFIVNILGC